MRPLNIFLEDYNYPLPESSIAEFPVPIRDQSKMLVYSRGLIKDETFRNLPSILVEETFIVLNNTKVVNARLLFQKPSGGTIEIFCLEPFDVPINQALLRKDNIRWKCLIGGASKWKKGQVLQMDLAIDNLMISLKANYISKIEDHFVIEFSWSPTEITFSEILRSVGLIPLPPYLKRKPIAEDAQTYQTIFSVEEGSVAAPTAALHFTENIFNELSSKKILWDYITLHVGAGTFKPVKSEYISGHTMHSEPFSISKKILLEILAHQTIVAVGTTTLRTLESIHWLGIKLINNVLTNDWSLDQWDAYDLLEKYPSISLGESLNAIIKWMNNQGMESIYCRTSLLIVPGYSFQIVKGLITNFHQPKSTLLLLISAFIGPDWKKVYDHALTNNYRFLSYGDSSLLWRTT